MDSQGGHVMTIANSIIGVSILAMPYCFKQCGLILSSLMLILSSIISRLSCHFLLKSSIIAKNKSIESIAFFTFGSFGKLTIELGIIGFLLGTCIAFFVVMGDLGPQIVADMAGIPATDTLRTTVLIILAVFCVLPLGLLRQVDSLTFVCTAAIGFYMCLVLKIMTESAPHLMDGDWYNQVYFWRTEGILQCLPIFSIALFCQTQLFEIYQAIPNANLDRMNNMIRMAVNICTCVYIFVGTFGYIAVCDQPFTGNILLSFKSSLITEIIKIGFVLSVAVSFPLIIFPCRASLFSMIYSQAYKSLEYGRSYIPDTNFRFITVAIISISLLIGVLIPNIELVLGLIGSTIGVLICVLFPATSFICLSKKNTNERILAQVMMFIGVLVMVLGTYANLNVEVEAPNKIIIDKIEVVKPKIDKIPIAEVPTTIKIDLPNLNDKKGDLIQPEISNEVIHEARHEPPQPVEPEAEPIKDVNIEIPKVIIPEENKIELKPTTKETVKNIIGDIRKMEEISINEIPKNEINKNEFNNNELNKNAMNQNKIDKNDINKNHEMNKNDEINKNERDIDKDEKELEKDESQLNSDAIKKEEKEIKLQQEEIKIEEDKAKGEDKDKNVEQKLEEKVVKIDEWQKQAAELLEKQQQLLAEIHQSKIEQEAIKEIEAEKMKSINEIKELAKSVMDHIALDKDKTTEKNILKELIESKRNIIDDKKIVPVKASQFVNNSDKGKVYENFVPIPIVKSNLSMYNYEIKNVSNQNIKEKKINETVKTVSTEKIKTIIVDKIKNKLENQNEVQNNSKQVQLNNSINEEKLALESVRRDILSMNNSSRRKREVNNLKEEIKNENNSKQCEKTT